MSDWAEWSRQAVAEMQARNDQWVKRFSLQGAPYRWDLGTAELTFERASDHVVADLCLIGTVSEPLGTFCWAWANEATPPAGMRGLELVRAFGEAHDLPRLITPEWPGGLADGLEMLAVAGRLQDADGVFVDREQDLTLLFTLSRFRVRHRGGAEGRAGG
jgi:hypothetical protein